MEKKYENGQRTFFFVFHFLKQLKSVLGIQKWKFSVGKSISHQRKKS